MCVCVFVYVYIYICTFIHPKIPLDYESFYLYVPPKELLFTVDGQNPA